MMSNILYFEFDPGILFHNIIYSALTLPLSSPVVLSLSSGGRDFTSKAFLIEYNIEILGVVLELH